MPQVAFPWHPPYEQRSLNETERIVDGVVYVWLLELNLAKGASNSLRELLSAEEAARAERFVFEKHALRFSNCRGQVRKILAWCLRDEPANLVFETDENGKPQLAPRHAGGNVRFNVSHSHERALLAVTSSREVGVDMEKIRPITRLDSLARRCYTDRERTALEVFDPTARQAAFFRLWTVKEAVLKSVGVGLRAPLTSVETGAGDSEPFAPRPNLVNIQGRTVFVMDLPPIDDYRAALAIEGKAPETVFCGRASL